MEAALKHNVKKIVVTSSVAAIIYGHTKLNFNEEDWTDLDKKPSAYSKAKTLAERKAWEIYEKNKDKIKLTCINPVII